CAAALLTALSLLPGCANESRLPSNDPLSGGGPAIPSRTEQIASAPSAPKSSVPPLPVPSSATSNAALAGGAFQPLDPTRELRIGNGDSSAASGTGRGSASGLTAIVSRPQPTGRQAPPGYL